MSANWKEEAMSFVLAHHGVKMDNLTDSSLESLEKKIKTLHGDLRARMKKMRGKYQEFRDRVGKDYLSINFEFDLELRTDLNDFFNFNDNTNVSNDTNEQGNDQMTNDRNGVGANDVNFEDMSTDDDDKPKRRSPKKMHKTHKSQLSKKKIKRLAKKSRGKKKKRGEDFKKAPKSTQRGRFREIRKKNSDEELIGTVRQILTYTRKGGKVAGTLYDQLFSNPSIAREISRRMVGDTLSRMSNASALGFFLKNQQSKIRYNQMRWKSLEEGADIWPPYKNLLAEKKKTYPVEVIIRDYEAIVPLKSLLTRTVERLLEVPGVRERIRAIRDRLNGQATFIFRFKWGIDGTHGGSVYREGQGSGEDNMVENVLYSQMAFLELRCVESNELVTRNKFMNSSSTMRPLRVAYEKEDQDAVVNEFNRISAEVASLVPIEIMEGVRVRFEHFPTLFDGKNIGYIVDEGFQNCNLCGHGPVEMSIPNQPHPVIHPEGVAFGFTNLHAGPRFMEFCLHLTYMYSELLMMWRMTGASEEQIEEKEMRKIHVHEILYLFLGIRVDEVKKNWGTSNTGNVARVFFANPSLTAELLGLPEELVVSLALIWKIIRSTKPIDPAKVYLVVDRFKAAFWGNFKKEFDETKKKTKKDRDREGITWYYISSSVHRLTEHLKLLLENCPIPPGCVSEEGSESNNKVLRFIREKLTRKFSRKQTMEDVIHRLLAISDPVVLHHNQEDTLKHRKKRPLDPDLVQFLMDPEDAEDWDQDMEFWPDDILDNFDGLVQGDDEDEAQEEEEVNGEAEDNPNEPARKRRRVGDGPLRLSDYLKNKKVYEVWKEDPAYVAATNNPGPNLEEPQRVEETRATRVTEETEKTDDNYEELIQTQDFLERRNIIEVHGYRHFVQWFEDWRFFTHCQLYGVNAPLHLLNPTRPRRPNNEQP